jgi:GT2 family glycosyltransferase
MSSVLVVVPMYGRARYTDALLDQLLEDGQPGGHHLRCLVVDNRGDYVGPDRAEVAVVRPARNLQWIGSANFGFQEAVSGGFEFALALNNDVTLARHFVPSLVSAASRCPDLGVLAPVYDDYWTHQRSLYTTAIGTHLPVDEHRAVPFCDGTAMLVPTSVLKRVGLLDEEAFPWHGYGADVDYGLRVRRAGLRCWVTERAYLSHGRRGTIRVDEKDNLESRIRHEFGTRLAAKWGPEWATITGVAALPAGPSH